MDGERTATPQELESPELSVVVCSVGGAELERAVDSLLTSAGRAGARVEIVVVWQGAESPPPPSGDVRVLDVFPLGISYARNRGLAVARAPLVGFVDDDEVVDPGWVEGALSAFSRGPIADGVFGPVQPLDEDGLPHCLFEVEEPRVFAGPSTPPWVVGTGGNMVFWRDVLLDGGGFDPLFGAGAEARAADESDLIVRLLRGGHRLARSPELTVYHPTKTTAERLAARYPYGYGMGRVARRHRAPVLAARYLKSTLQYLLGGVHRRDSQQRREAARTLRGFVRGALSPVVPLSPAGVADRVPEEVRRLLDGTRLERLPMEYGSTPRLQYGGNGLLLNVYVQPPAGLGEAHEGADGVRAVASGRDSLWVLEERTPAAVSPPAAL